VKRARIPSQRIPLLKIKSLKDQLVGTWTLVSSDQVRPDGQPGLNFPLLSGRPNGCASGLQDSRLFFRAAGTGEGSQEPPGAFEVALLVEDGPGDAGELVGPR
jgi:hypothetical protein